MAIRTPICEMFGIEHPVFLAGMGNVAYAPVVAAVSEAGGLGTLGMVAAPPEHITAEIRRVRERTDKPFGVDMLAALPAQMSAAIDAIIDGGAAVFVAGLGVPEDLVKKCHDGGVKVMVVCGKVSHAVAAQEAGCDAVIAQGTEAGGHTGKVAGMALIPQTVDAVDIPVLAAGSIVDGRGLSAALAFGAQGVWMGTRFVASEEASAADAYKATLERASSADTIITRVYSGKPMRVINNPHVEASDPGAVKPFPQQMMDAGRNGLLNWGEGAQADPSRTAMPAGQGVGGIDRVLPAGEIVRRVMQEAEANLRRLGGLPS